MRRWASVKNISGLEVYLNFDCEKIYEIASGRPDEKLTDLPERFEYIAAYLKDHTKKPVIAEAFADFDLSWTTPFQLKIYKALANIPCGDMISYGALAELAGRPGAARAVGSAMSKNRFIIAIPCHRVIAAGRKLGGFSSGLDNKILLLKSEGIYDF